MKSVSLRKLRNCLSQYIREVRHGQVVLVTDRGKVVAEILPPGRGISARGVAPDLVALARGGQITLGAANDPALYPKLPPVLKRRSAKQLLDQERGPR
jgi:prevent-host-death family protein